MRAVGQNLFDGDVDLERLGAVVVVEDEHDRRLDTPEIVEQQRQGGVQDPVRAGPDRLERTLTHAR